MNNTIKNYIVKITYKTYGGSGVIVPLTHTKEYFYIFTAKHTFFDANIKDEDKNIDEIDETDEKIRVENPIAGYMSCTKANIVSDINKEYDFLVLRIEKREYPDINLEPLPIFSDDFTECVIMGYPKVRNDKDTAYDAFTCFYKQQNNKPYIFEVDSGKLLTTHRDKELNPKDTMSGISGSGVFVRGSTGGLYLAGIQIQSATHNALIAIDLREIFDELNQKLENTLSVGGYQFFEEIGLDIGKLEFLDLKEKLATGDIQSIKRYKESHTTEVDFLEQENYIREMTTKYNDLQGRMKNLADTYLYQGIIFHENKKNQKATNRFKKAITLYPEYKHYFAKAKYEREKLTEKQKEEKEKIEKDNTLSNDINMHIDSLRSDIEKYEKDKNHQELEFSYRKTISLLHINFDANKEEIISLSKKLSVVLIKNKDFLGAENLLLKLEDDEVSTLLYQIYIDDDFNKKSSINKKQLSNKFIDLLGRLDKDSSKYNDVKNRLEELNIFDNQMIDFHEKFISLEKKYESNITKLTKDIQLLSTHISDKTLLNKINYQVYNSDKKLENISIELSDKIDIRANKTDKKLDLMSSTFKKTNNQKLDSFLENIYNSNRALVGKIQTIYHQNDRLNRIAQEHLSKSIKNITEKLNESSPHLVESFQDESKYIDEVKDIIEKSNGNFYKEIQELFKKETNSYNKKMLDMSIDFTTKENQLHIENLENIIEGKNREVLSIDLQLKKANEWIDEINKKYESQQVKSEEVEIQVSELKEMNEILEQNISTSDASGKDLINLEKYKLKIKQLEELIISLKGRNEELKKENKNELEIYIQRIEEKYEELGREKKTFLENNFSEILKDISSSIDTPSSEPLDKEAFEKIYLALENLDTKLDSMEDNYELKVDKLNERFTKLISNPKNGKRLRKISEQIKDFEEKLKNVKVGDSKITLRLVESDLNKIEKIMRKHKGTSIYQTYCGVRQVIIGVMFMMSIIALFINEPYSEFIKEFSLNSIVKFLK